MEKNSEVHDMSGSEKEIHALGELVEAKIAEQTPEDNLDQFKTKEVALMSRNERRSRLRFFKKQMNKHVLKKPNIDVESDDPNIQEGNVQKVRAWATRYGILSRKILDLGGTQKDLKRAV